MRQCQLRSVDRNVVIGDQIEVEGARTPAFFLFAVAAELFLDFVQGKQQRVRIEAGFDFDAGVDEAVLLLPALWRRQVIGGTREQGGLRHAADVADRFAKYAADIADIAPERDQNICHQNYFRVRVRTTPTSSKIAAIGACGL